MTDCEICMEPTNKTKRKLINCPYCKCNLCSACLKASLLEDDSPEPKCPGCKAVYNRHILLSMFPVSFLTKDYKIHRENVLLDAEKSRLPESQIQAENYLASKKFIDERNKHIYEKTRILHESDAYKDFKKAKDDLENFTKINKYYWKFHDQYKIYFDLVSIKKKAEIEMKKSTEYNEINVLNRWSFELGNHQNIVNTYGRYQALYDNEGHSIPLEKKERQKHFIKACPLMNHVLSCVFSLSS